MPDPKAPVIDLRDLLTFGGLILATVGAGLYDLRAAVTVLGTGLYAVGFLSRARA